MDKLMVAILRDGSKIKGRLTTDHAASSYGQPVFVDRQNQAINWADIIDLSEAAAMGSSTSDRKARTSAENGKKGGRPRKTQTEINNLIQESKLSLHDFLVAQVSMTIPRENTSE